MPLSADFKRLDRYIVGTVESKNEYNYSHSYSWKVHLRRNGVVISEDPEDNQLDEGKLSAIEFSVNGRSKIVAGHHLVLDAIGLGADDDVDQCNIYEKRVFNWGIIDVKGVLNFELAAMVLRKISEINNKFQDGEFNDPWSAYPEDKFSLVNK